MLYFIFLTCDSNNVKDLFLVGNIKNDLVKYFMQHIRNGLIIIGIKHGFSCINVCQVPREVLKTEAEGRGFQHLPRDLANVNVLENNV